MKRVPRWIAPVVAVLILAVVYWAAPGGGGEGATRVRTPAKRAQVVEAMSDWLASELGGTAVVYRVATWSGGVTENGTPIRALESDFNGGVFFLPTWPFYASFSGYVDESDVGGYRAQVDARALDAAMKSPASVPQAARARLQESAASLIKAASPPVDYDAAQIAQQGVVGLDQGGELAFGAALPPAAGSREGSFEIILTSDLQPCFGSLDTRKDY